MFHSATAASRVPMNLHAIHSAIQAEIARIGSTDYRSFHSVGAFLFIEDPYSRCLEPVFDSKQRPYEELDSVATECGPDEPERRVPNSIEDAGIASVAYQHGTAFSQDPQCDFRFGARARALHAAYGISGSFMASRLDDFFGTLLGVLVVHSSDRLLDLPKPEEDAILATLLSNTERLRALLQLRREAYADRELECFQRFLTAALHDARTPRTVARTCADFENTCRELFGVKALFIGIPDPNSNAAWFPPPSDQVASALNDLRVFSPQQRILTLNRHRHAPQLADTLASAFGDVYVWCRITTHVNAQRVVCVAMREVNSILKHWEQHDVALLTHAADVLSTQLARSYNFSHLLTHLTRVNGSDAKQHRFEFLSQLLHDYFGFDQVLIAKVKRKPDSYKICTEFATGFGANEGEMSAYPKEYREGDCTLGSFPDVMIRIVHDFIAGTLQQVYPYPADNPVYSIDSRLVAACDLKPPMYFLPCCTNDSDDSQQLLECILHLGSSDESIALHQDSLPIITSLSSHIAAWHLAERSREAAALMRDIRELDDCSQATMHTICKHVATGTAALGCTLFLNASAAALLGLSGLHPEALADALLRLVNEFDVWPLILGIRDTERLVAMFAAFLGVRTENCCDLLSSGIAQRFARHASRVLYVRVAQSNESRIGAELVELNEMLSIRHSEDFVYRFGAWLVRNAYLPGFGLTGWVLLYRRQMSLRDKSDESLRNFYSQVRSLADPPWRHLLLADLHAAGVSSTLERCECTLPVHADHISEDPERQAPHDSFHACPIEGIETVDLPLGVLRISNSARVRRGFTLDDDAIVHGAALHVSHLLRRQYMMRDTYLAGVLQRVTNEQHFHHCILKFNEYIVSLRRILRHPKSGLAEPDRRNFETVVDRLSEVCDSALATPLQESLACRIREAGCIEWSIEQVGSGLDEWLRNEKMPCNILIAGELEHADMTPEVLTMTFQVIHELLKNHKLHQGIASPIVQLRVETCLGFYVGSARALEMLTDDRPGAWKPYIGLMQEKPSGGGTKLILKATELAHLDVEFTMIDVENSFEMIARVRQHVGGSAA